MASSSKEASISDSEAPSSSGSAWLKSHGQLVRKVLSLTDASEAADLLMDAMGSGEGMSESDCCELIAAALDKGNVKLALSLHAAMRASARKPQLAGGVGSGGGSTVSFSWPAATIRATSVLVLGLCRQIAIGEASRTISEIRIQGVPRHEEVWDARWANSPTQSKMNVHPDCRLGSGRS